MADEQAFEPIIVFDNDEQNAANKKILNRIASAMFMFFAPDDEETSDEELDRLYEELGGVATIAMAAARMQIIGENIGGDYVVQFEPYLSFDEFIKNSDFSK